MKDDAAIDPALLALDWLGQTADWPRTAAALYDAAVCWRAPARGLLLQGRDAALAQLRADARSFSGADHVVLRRMAAGERLIDESTLTFTCPAEGIAGLELAAGERVELNRRRLFTFSGGLIVDELHLETWTVLRHTR
ncbi:MAG: nuclear transport factor 2 family protein [Burkholderiales bacterium]|nr:nuclear transport factor 2 family protein [Burkholderiales bacterium]